MNFSPGFKKYFANTSWLMAERILSMVVGLFVGIYVARYLGPERFGLLNYAISFVALFSPLSKLGLDGIVVREIVKCPDRREIILGSAFCLKIVGAVILFGIVAVIVFFQGSNPVEKMLVLVIAAGMLLDTFQVYDFNNQAAVRMKYSSIAAFAANILSAVFRLWLIFLGASLIWFAIAVVLQKGILVFAWRHFYKFVFGSLGHWKFDLRLAVKFLNDSWPLIFSSLAVVIYMKIDQVMIKLMLNAQVVGEYAAAVRLSEAWYFMPVLIMQSVFPSIVESKENDELKYNQKMQRLFLLMTVFSYIVIVPTCFFHNYIVQLLFGNQYAGAANILVVHVFALIFVSFGVVSGSWLITENCTGLAFWRTFIGMLCNVAANLVMIPRWGGVGAAWATVLSYAVAGYFFDLFTDKMRPMFKRKTCSMFFVKCA